MLVLARRVGEQIVIPDLGIVVEIVSVEGKKVKLGFNAPRDVSIHRKEVWERLQEQLTFATAPADPTG